MEDDLDGAVQWQKSVIQAAGSPPIYSTPYMNGRATTRGVFKAFVFFLFLSFDSTVSVPPQKEVVIQDGGAYNYGSAIFPSAIPTQFTCCILFIVLIPAEILFYYKSHITDWTLVLFL